MFSQYLPILDCSGEQRALHCRVAPTRIPLCTGSQNYAPPNVGFLSNNEFLVLTAFLQLI
ncbi:hypothetical protein C0Q70_11441 [Pomacea canaliculata]|uniref:Uncharacterized protein n=1 Tax=Pomacea canaliculata TaxID=400727 RepID=A0A2T7P618_POMCA|nr:hypothetical protein C0Q70_11441 [Pomacea canaliculata]